MPDAEAIQPLRPAFCLFVCEVEPMRRKVGVAHGVQLIGGLAGQRRHVLVHIRQGGPDVGRRPAPVGLVIHTDQVFFFHGKLYHCHTSNSFSWFWPGPFSRLGPVWFRIAACGWKRGAAALPCPGSRPCQSLHTGRAGLSCR